MFLKRSGETTSHAGKIIAPISGEIIPIAKVSDQVFSEKVLGDGVAVIPTDNRVLSPVDGTIIDVAKTLHAFCILTEDGVEILLHIGIDTVELEGAPFACQIKPGDKVKIGQLLCKVNFEAIKASGRSTETPILITNSEDFKKMMIHTGTAQAGETCILEYGVN